MLAFKSPILGFVVIGYALFYYTTLLLHLINMGIAVLV